MTDLETDYQLVYRLHEQARLDSEKKLFNFFVNAWPTMEPNTPLQNNWHIGLICEHLEAVTDREIKILLLNIPTRYLKSKQCTIAWPAWAWVNDPGHRWIFSSYGDSLSSTLSADRRALIESNWYQTYWSHKVKLKADQNQKTYYETVRKGSMRATSTGGSILGEGCDTMVIDDPTQPKEAANDNVRERAIVHWKSTLSSRFNDPKNKALVVVMQRLHERDLTGYFLAEKYDCTHLVIPNECEERTVYTYPKTGRIKIYNVGEVLHPAREGIEELEIAKKDLGSFDYAAQRQQRPAPRKGGMVKTDWFKFYDIRPSEFDAITLSMDASFKGVEGSDYVVIQAWGKIEAKHYLLHQIRALLSFTKTVPAALSLRALFPDHLEFLIEEKANGAAICDQLETEHGISNLIRINPKDSKVARLNACAPIFEAGNIILPNKYTHPWVEDYIKELITFPKAAKDDQVDATTQYLNRQRQKQVGTFGKGFLDSGGGQPLAGSLNSGSW